MSIKTVLSKKTRRHCRAVKTLWLERASHNFYKKTTHRKIGYIKMLCEQQFATIYGRSPDGISFSPYRICPIGAHSDHNLGKITGFAINSGIHISFSPKHNGVVEMMKRIRAGESKYVIRELYKKKYPDLSLPEKLPMPRPVDIYFKDWQGPTRPEFRRDIDMSALTGNQKWLLYCLEQFLNMHEPLKIGYTTGVYDLFHIGHLNLLRKAKAQCDYLIVGVSTDDLVEYKGKRSVIPFEERKEIVRVIRYVDEVVTQENMDKLGAWKKYHFDVMFVGDDWKGTDKWNKIESELAEVGAKVVYFPYTKGTSSTLINETLIRLRENK